MAGKKSEHAGHRQRMRKKYLEYGIEIFAPHEVLEILLYYAIPRKDTNTTAHKLIDEFGSISAVLDAPHDSLVSSGISGDAALFLNLLPEFLEAYMEDRFQNNNRVMNENLITQKLINFYSGKNNEIVYLILTDSNSNELYSDIISCDLAFSVELDITKICELAIRYSAQYVIISHNHPNNAAIPSQADIMTTIKLYRALRRLNVVLEDHYLVSEDRCISFRDSGILFKSKEEFMNSSFYDNPLFN